MEEEENEGLPIDSLDELMESIPVAHGSQSARTAKEQERDMGESLPPDTLSELLSDTSVGCGSQDKQESREVPLRVSVENFVSGKLRKNLKNRRGTR